MVKDLPGWEHPAWGGVLSVEGSAPHLWSSCQGSLNTRHGGRGVKGEGVWKELEKLQPSTEQEPALAQRGPWALKYMPWWSPFSILVSPKSEKEKKKKKLRCVDYSEACEGVAGLASSVPQSHGEGKAPVCP